MLSFSQQSSSTPYNEEEYGMPWEVSLSHSKTNHLKTCCDTLVITFRFILQNEFEPNPAFAQLKYFGPDQELILENCNRIPINGGVDHMIQIDTTFPSVDDLIQETGNPNINYVFATVKVPNTYYNTTVEAAEFNPTWKDTTGAIRGMSNIFFNTEGPKSCFTSDSVSNLVNEGEILNNKKLSIGLDDFAELIVDEHLIIGDPQDFVGHSFVGKASSIRVLSGDTLEIYNNEFIACRGYFWKGIYLEEDATLIMNDVLLTAAEHGILFEKGAIMSLDDNIFENNFIHMKGKGKTVPLGGGSSGSNTKLESFENNIFRGNDNGAYTGQGVFPKKYSGQSTNPQYYPYAGIVIGNTSSEWISCGTVRFTNSDNSKLNEFTNMANGIINKRNGANLYVKGASFYNINSNYGQGYNTVGFGIKHNALLKPCIVNGFSSWPDEYSFSNVDIAIQTNYASIVKFDKQVVDQCKRGVYSTKTLLSSYVNNNTFRTSWNSIEIANSNIRREFEIIENDINLDIPTTQVLDKGGIVLSNVNCQVNQYFSNSTSKISENSINTNEGEVGIGLFDVENLSVEDNFIGIARDITDAKGISALGGNKVSITCNDIQGSYGDIGNDTLTTGIYFDGLNKSTITCNDIYKTHTAVQVHLMNEIQLKGNALHTNSIGIEYGNDAEPNAQTGPQEYNGNQWLTAYSPGQGEYGALHNAIQRIAEKSQYTVNDNQGSEYTTMDYPNFITEDDDDNNFSCQDSLPDCTITLGLVIKQWDRLDSIVFTDTLFKEHLLRDLQWKVYRNMKENILAHDGNFNILASNVGIYEMYEADSSLQKILQYMELDTFPDSIISISSVDTLSNTQLDDLFSELAANYEQMQAGLETYISNEAWTTSTEDPYLNNLSSALSQEASLWSSENGYLSTFEIGVCSYKGGDAWNRMNALQPADAISYSLYECAYGRESFITEQINEFELKISPNPTDYELQVQNIDGLSDSKMNYSIFDLNGRLVQSGQVTDSGMIRLNAKFQSGLYILRIDQQSFKFNVFR